MGFWMQNGIGIDSNTRLGECFHAHGCAKLKNDPDMRLLCNRVRLAFLENETTRHEMSPDDFEFFYQEIVKEGKDAKKLLIQ